jgi:hypothetical protein
MNDNQFLFERQSEWQRNRACLSWPEKIRMAEAVQETLRQFRSLANDQPPKGKGGVKRDAVRTPEP